MKKVTFDGYRLSFPSTGLGLVTAELLRAFQELGYAKSIAVFVEKSFNPQIFELENVEVQWIPVDFKNYSPDYLGRLAWGRAVTKELKKRFGSEYQHFIPYFYNYGNLRQNVVLVPDLIYKIPIHDTYTNPKQPWWNWRGRLPLRRMFVKWEEWLATRAQHFVVYSEFVRHSLHQELAVPIDRITLVPLATPNWVKIHYDQRHNEKVQADFKLPSRFVLYVGGFPVRKNIPMLLRAGGRVYKADPSFRCVFVGLTESVIQNDYGIRTAMSDASVKAATICLPSLSYKDLASVYRLAEFTVYPSMSEGFGLPLLEAAAAKRLCLSGDNSSMIEIQIYPEYRIDANNENAWVERILYFWQNQKAAKQAGEDCENLCHKFCWRKSAETLWEILQS